MTSSKGFKRVWLLWLLFFVGFETAAIITKNPTLSQTTWEELDIREGKVTTGRVVLGVGLLWLLLHLTRVAFFG